ncbi:hypothetical protein E0F15_11150 [Frankia sp. B2]|uniref:hypothetical protein n=1 Tax=Frankia sp. B2 TaxID=2541730 RepID=UPI0010699FF8|nr:hypothetical protein [Frankia sp. B2]TFE31031.1 hypothetical protein E0F15_11150 [Frankia sp. B2]
MSALLTAVLIPARPHRPVTALRFPAEEIPLLWAEVGGPIERVMLLDPAGALIVNGWGVRYGLPANARATALAAAANPVWRGGTIVGDAVLVGAASGGAESCADPAYTDVLLVSGRVGIEIREPSGDTPGIAVPPVEWSDPFAAYTEGLRLARGYPLCAVRVHRLG